MSNGCIAGANASVKHTRTQTTTMYLAAEAVEGPALPLERVHDVHGRDGLPPGVLSVGHRVADDVLEEHLEDTAGLLVDGAGDALHTAPPREPADRGLGDALDVVAQHLAVTLGSALAEPLASLSASGLHTCNAQQDANVRPSPL